MTQVRRHQAEVRLRPRDRSAVCGDAGVRMEDLPPAGMCIHDNMTNIDATFMFFKKHQLGCGTVRVELKLRFTGYRLPFTVSRYGLKKKTRLLQIFKFPHQKSLLRMPINIFLAPKWQMRERPL